MASASGEPRRVGSDVNFEDISHVLENDIIIFNTEKEILKYLEENYVPQENFKKIITANKAVFDKCLSTLDEIYGDTLIGALGLVQTNSVRFYTCKSKDIGVYQVIGKSDYSYTLFPRINYCYCPDYNKRVVAGSLLSCKHVLATKLAKILGKVRYFEIAPQRLHDLLLYVAGVDEFSSAQMNKREERPDQNQFMEPCVYPQSEFRPPNNWIDVLPPQAVPWRLTSNLHPPVVRFTAGDFTPPQHPMKRKLNVAFDLRTPPKQFVTDERMAAHMSNLHISDVKSQYLNPEDEPMDTDRLPKLVVCDKVKNLKTEPIIPQSILDEIERPKMAVVLWQPPGNDLMRKLAGLKNEKEKNEKDENSMVVENNNVDNIFRPIDPVPMRPVSEDHFLQPTPQLHGNFPFCNK